MENITITTTTAATFDWPMYGGTTSGTNWYVVDTNGNDFAIVNNSLEALRSDFKKLSDEFFMDHETEYHHNERLDRYYNRKADNEAIVALMS